MDSPKPDRNNSVKIATFNINNVNRRLPNLLQWLEVARPDIACLQELKCTDAEFPATAIKKAGYHAVWHGQRTWNGVAILARNAEPVETAPTEIDIYPTKSWDDDALIQPASRAAYAKLVKQGWTDSLRTLNPDKRIYTFWHYMRHRWERDAGLRLDHLLLSPELAERLKDGWGRSCGARQARRERSCAGMDRIIRNRQTQWRNSTASRTGAGER